MKTIHYVGDITYFSARSTTGKYQTVEQALRAHRRYISRGGRDENVTPIWTQGDKVWEGRVKNRKRWDSRVGGKFVIALPNALEEQDELVAYVEELLEKIAHTWNLPRNHIEAYIHTHAGITAERNNHVHILFYPYTLDGKALRLSPKDLSTLHKLVDEHAQSWGFSIARDTEGTKLPHIGYMLRKSRKLMEEYKEYQKNKELYEELERELSKLLSEEDIAEILRRAGWKCERKGSALYIKGTDMDIMVKRNREGCWIFVGLNDSRIVRAYTLFDFVVMSGLDSLLRQYLSGKMERSSVVRLSDSGFRRGLGPTR